MPIWVWLNMIETHFGMLMDGQTSVVQGLITVTIQNFQPYQQHLSSVQNSSWLMIIGVYTSHIVDGCKILHHLDLDGWNPINNGVFTIYQLVQDLFHPQSLLGSSTVHWGNLGNPATWGQYHQLRGIFGQNWGGQVPKWRWWVDLNDHLMT